MANVVWFDQNKIYEAGFTKPPRDWQAAATTRGNSQKPRRGENSMALVFCPELPKSDCPRTTLMSHRAKAHPMKPHPISYGELMRLGVDDSNRLYSDRKPVIIEQRLTLGSGPKLEPLSWPSRPSSRQLRPLGRCPLRREGVARQARPRGGVTGRTQIGGCAVQPERRFVLNFARCTRHTCRN
jgi:hypothetical protein